MCYIFLGDLDQLQVSFRILSIHSSLLNKYHQLTLQKNIDTIIHSFINECHLFLHNYGCLLDQYTYRLIKEIYLYELEHNNKRVIHLSTKIIQLIKSIIGMQKRETFHTYSSVSNTSYKQPYLEPIVEVSNEKLSAPLTAKQDKNFLNKSAQSNMKNLKTCHTNSFSLSSYKNLYVYDTIDDDYSINPLVKCYYRHINEQVDSIVKRCSYLLQNEYRTPLLLTEAKAFVVAGHKLVFVLETLHEHSQKTHTLLTHLTTQLCEALRNLVELLKEVGKQNYTNIRESIMEFNDKITIIMNIVKRIKQYCRLV